MYVVCAWEILDPAEFHVYYEHYTPPNFTAKDCFTQLVTSSFVECVKPKYCVVESGVFLDCLNVQALFECDVLESAKSGKFVGINVAYICCSKCTWM